MIKSSHSYLFQITKRMMQETGEIALLIGQIIRVSIPPRVDRNELLKHTYRMANMSLPIIALTAFFVSGILILQSSTFVKQFDAKAIVGWATGFSLFREIGPIMIALMFSGRIGANNTAELGAMTITNQIDGLKALAIDPIEYLIAPRVYAMVFSLFILTTIGIGIAILGAMLFSIVILDMSYLTFYRSLFDNLYPADFIHGLVKSIAFGIAIALTSCHFGMNIRQGAIGVGHSVNAAVVSSAIAIILFDFFLTYMLA